MTNEYKLYSSLTSTPPARRSAAKRALHVWAARQPDDTRHMSVHRKTQCMRIIAVSTSFQTRRKVI